ncbi:hypothetical protein Scipio_00060 [Acinetobacter phage Scipio]|nr:hypothetical protein Scipio_00060 [Acinetobacter phage Scipio]
MIQCGVRLPEDLKAKLEKIAKDDMRSFNSLLNKVLSDYCDKVEKRMEESK